MANGKKENGQLVSKGKAAKRKTENRYLPMIQGG